MEPYATARTALIATVLTAACTAAAAPLKLWYAQPAKDWQSQALPIGNGRLGAMVFGGVGTERLALNEDTLWSGGPKDWNNPRAKDVLPTIRKALFEGKYALANELAKKMQGPYTQSAQPVGNVYLDFAHGGKPETYHRELDLDRAVVTIRYTVDEATYTREIFSSFPDQVIVIRLTCDKPGKISFTARADSLLAHTLKTAGKDGLALDGKCPKHVDPSYLRSSKNPVIYADDPAGEGMTFRASVKVLATGGKTEAAGKTVRVTGADSATVLVAAATSFNGPFKSPGREGRDPTAIADAYIAGAAGKTYSALLAAHAADYTKLFGRVKLDLGGAALAKEPTDERLEEVKHGRADPHLAMTYFQYGRYLMIAASRPGSQPIHLQGIWNDKLRPPWSDNYTMNINVQMSYWPAEMCNLAECHEPLIRMMRECSVTGAKTAKINYGLDGWLTHHNVDIWRHTGAVGDYRGSPQWANWPMGGAWTCQHLWDHYAFGLDESYLRKTAYPLMKGAAVFCLGWLIEDSEGRLVTAPATSPENGFRTPAGQRSTVSIATTMDMAIIWDLFSNCIEASAVLEVDEEFRKKLTEARKKLFPMQIGRLGQLQEWFKDWDNPKDRHRHLSHMFGLHPGRQISPLTTPKLSAAVKKSLELRGDGGTGWSKAWKVNLWARLHDGERAHKLLSELLARSTLPNMLDSCPPMIIDGNFGGTSGITEMLLQSQRPSTLSRYTGPTKPKTPTGRPPMTPPWLKPHRKPSWLGKRTSEPIESLHILPALPSAWPDGKVTGLRARGGFGVDITWAKGKLVEAVVRASKDRKVRVRYGEKTYNLRAEAGKTYRVLADMTVVKPEDDKP